MTMDYQFGDGQIIEYEILTEAQAKRLIHTVMDAITGKTQIDYLMTGEWVQLKPKTVIDRIKLKSYNDGWKSVGLRDVKSKTPEIKPPQVIVRHRHKAHNRVKRALDMLFKHDIINTFTIRPNGYLWISWFDGYVQTERVSWKHWTVSPINQEVLPLTEHDKVMEYLRDRVMFSGSGAEAMRQSEARKALSKSVNNLYGYEYKRSK